MGINPECLRLLEDGHAIPSPSVARPIALLFRHGADRGGRVSDALYWAEYWADQFTAANPALTASPLGAVVPLSDAWRGIIEGRVRPDRIAYRAAAIERKDHPLLDELRAQGVEIVMLPSTLSGLG